MKYQEWLVGRIRLVSSILESQMLIEMKCGCVLLIYVDFSDGVLQGEVDKSFTNPLPCSSDVRKASR